MSAFRSLRLVSSLRAIPTLRTALPLRYYASSSLSKTDIEARVLNIVKAFDKVKDPSKISATSTFANDLGLDSLDTVEVVMAIEEEFNVEIPDKDADEIKSVGQAIEYIAKHGDGTSHPSQKQSANEQLNKDYTTDLQNVSRCLSKDWQRIGISI